MIDEFAKVVAIHPESNQVDVVCLRTGARYAGVRVLSPVATGQTGTANLHMPDCTNGYDSENTGKRDVVAGICFYREVPFVVGFLYPEVSECLFDRNDFKVDRHASDVYSTVDANGDMELHHPSGAYVRIAQDPAHEDLTGKDYDGIWAIKRNTDKRVHIHVEQAGGVAFVDITPDGQIDVYAKLDINVTTDKTMNVVAKENVNITAEKNVNITAEENVTMLSLAQTNITAMSNIAITSAGGTDSKISVSGNSEIRTVGFMQHLAEGPLLIKSDTGLRLQGPRGSIDL